MCTEDINYNLSELFVLFRLNWIVLIKLQLKKKCWKAFL